MQETDQLFLFNLRGHNWVHFAHSNCYVKFKLRYLKNLKSFSSRINELFEPIVLKKTKQNKTKQNKTKQKKPTGFCFSLYIRIRILSMQC